MSHLYIMSCVAGLLFVNSPLCQAEDSSKETTTVWIYKDFPEGEDKRSATEITFQPHFIYPQAAAEGNQVVITDQLTAAGDNLNGKDGETVCKFSFRVGAGQFAGVKFIPQGIEPGRHAGHDIARLLALTKSTPVSLKFRARTRKDETAKVQFKTGGTSGQRHSDTLTFPVSPKQNPVRLTDQWQTVEIVLTGKDLTQVICPLDIVVIGNSNAGKEEVTVYIDELRYEVGEIKSKDK
jgi:hypothetical protein